MSIYSGIGPAPAGHTPDPRFDAWPPWLFPPRGSTPVDVTSEGPVTVAPGATAKVLEYVVPSARALTINAIGFDALDPGALQAATWSVQVDGAWLEGYGRVPVGFGSIGDPGEVLIVVEKGREARVQVLVTNGSPGSSWDYLARIRGFLWAYAQ